MVRWIHLSFIYKKYRLKKIGIKSDRIIHQIIEFFSERTQGCMCVDHLLES